ncbi:MAG: hypothetical protein HY870_04515 [Chloroflexi bacterium]|nr:hypothetical protein [Chloroflexota bacterium]
MEFQATVELKKSRPRLEGRLSIRLGVAVVTRATNVIDAPEHHRYYYRSRYRLPELTVTWRDYNRDRTESQSAEMKNVRCRRLGKFARVMIGCAFNSAAKSEFK